MYWTLVLIETITFLTLIWAALWYFKAPDSSAHSSKKIISIFGTANIVLNVLGLIRFSSLNTGRMMFAIACFAAALTLFWWSLGAINRSHPNYAGASTAPSLLCTRGPYRWIRHPIYLSYALAWIGGAVGSSIWLLTTGALLFWLYLSFARAEERAILASANGPQYAEYMKGTGMFLPKFAAKA